MNRLSKEKRNQLILVTLVILMVLVLIGFSFIRPQFQNLSRIADERKSAQTKLQQIKDTIKQEDAVQTQLSDISDKLSEAENDMASGDLYAWTVDTIRRFKVSYHVDIPQIGQPEVADVDLLPNFPYQQLRVTVNGTAYYHDLGKFIADFENTFPHIRIVNLTIDPDQTSGAEKLSFRMDIVALVKTDSM